MPAAEEILKKLFEGSQLENLHAVLLVDLNPRVADFAHAFCKLRSQLGGNTSLFYLAVSEKVKDLEWMRLTLLDDLVEKSKTGQLSIPGMQPYQSEVSQDLLEALPTLPVMNLLVTSGEGEFKKLQLPHNLVKKWRTDDDYGDEFGKWLDSFVEKYSVTEEDAPMPSPRSDPTKSEPGGTTPAAEPSPKKQKVEEVAPEHIIKNDAIQDTLLFDVKISGKDSMSFQIRSGKKLYLVNLTGQELAMKANSALVGFGRGQFKLFKEGEAVAEKAVRFDVSKENCLVCLNGQVMTISDAVHQQRAKNPEAQVSYHKTVWEAEKNHYTFQLDKLVAFVPADKKSVSPKKPEKNDDDKEAALAASNTLQPRGLQPSMRACIAAVWCGGFVGRSKAFNPSSQWST